ncbi:hypothetical protein PAXRUDRAFT_227671 [Paxillus rubicundulus Ve08.2h10]|uniref:Uncharacterized protein n=1 Tax=Paxillus rubicundulus Ve08.2h10 TaxID=930991 RepID=A0A0D0DH50_9AGAM|nr:hypothetical protein PAXRUDRAFT_227671 [Paxillus rubicundulus Ve08.2h10]
MLVVWSLHCNQVFGKEDWTIRERKEGMGITSVEIKRAVTRRNAWRPRAVVGKDVNEGKTNGLVMFEQAPYRKRGSSNLCD